MVNGHSPLLHKSDPNLLTSLSLVRRRFIGVDLEHTTVSRLGTELYLPVHVNLHAQVNYSGVGRFTHTGKFTCGQFVENT